MPLTDIVLVLNSLKRPEADGMGPEFRFVSAGRRVTACYGSLRLKSRFIPLLDPDTGMVRGHRAELAATRLGSREAVDCGEAFALPADAAGIAHLDRLVCTLHALNYLLHPAPGILYLKVHPITLADSDWSLAFEDILRPCGLVPERMVLEIEADPAAPPGQAYFLSRGFTAGPCSTSPS